MHIFNRLFRKPFEVLVIIYNNKDINIAQITREMTIGYDYLHRTIKLLRKLGMIRISTISRLKYVRVTGKGEEIAKSMNHVYMKLKNA